MLTLHSRMMMHVLRCAAAIGECIQCIGGASDVLVWYCCTTLLVAVKRVAGTTIHFVVAACTFHCIVIELAVLQQAMRPRCIHLMHIDSKSSIVNTNVLSDPIHANN